MKVESWAHFEGLSSNSEANWLEFGSDVSARGHDLAEVVISDTVQIVDILSP